MFNKSEYWIKQLNDTMGNAKDFIRDFRIYDVGSYALNQLTPREGYTLHENIAYGLKARHRLDLFKTHKPQLNQPLIIFVHGGAWTHGDKSSYRFVGEAFAREGYDVAVINYHLAPQYIFPSYVDDLTLALNFLSLHQQKLAIRTDNVVLMGHSAGAFNVMSAVYHPQQYELQCRAQIRAIIGVAGPYHFDYKGDPLCAEAFDQSVPFQQVMPYYFVASNSIKHYLLMAENDQIVGHNNTEDFDRVLKEKGNHSKMIVIPRTGHITVMGSVSSLFSRYFETKEQILVSIEEALKP
ncbi:MULTISPECIES: alpha/beta hydrolase [Acinetobacter]|jgi:acetyl esterase/lipase|uniref:alpha/beta hydrolase n=1 Tax=Acinetobacter TaxID=469 RepID=UPI0005CD827E|nr:MULTISPECIES: alpha/beta hydrolase [unclassified Acinetobacter]AUX86642.1 alpha/beta hydrolase [Acinetobacter sp. ACNIH2]ELO6155780.1 alpha/beta hydrolase [Escherichia coli]UOG18406.1 alpha/beta hydrolase [Acinetobacter sp. PK01]